ncbi:hypothetical protein KJA17_01890, partial [Patescibacteria group bacterium]|nr:hypothetical protein [Patescibacteria group bacterium]
MAKLFKNFFSLKRFSKTTIISIVLFSIVLGLILPIHPVYAQSVWDIFLDILFPIRALGDIYEALTGRALAQDFFNAIILAIFAVAASVSGVFIGVCQSLLNWVMSPGFINVPFTNNSFVNAGWEIIRDLTNIAIVLGLVVIALATILRITTYHAKKTLPLLLIVALLVNFSPLICGIIIDGSNIVMSYFLKVGGLDAPFIGRIGHEI